MSLTVLYPLVGLENTVITVVMFHIDSTLCGISLGSSLRLVVLHHHPSFKQGTPFFVRTKLYSLPSRRRGMPGLVRELIDGQHRSFLNEETLPASRQPRLRLVSWNFVNPAFQVTFEKQLSPPHVVLYVHLTFCYVKVSFNDIEDR